MLINHLFSIIINVVIVSQINGVPLPTAKISAPNPEQNPGLFEGDIVLTSSTFKSTDRGVLRRGTSVPWPNGTVPYTFLPGFAPAQQGFIINAMELMERFVAINNVACIQFRPMIPTDQYYIRFFNGGGCSSPVGYMAGENINHTVSINYPGCFDNARIMHELLHTLGFFHEQSRPDRDNFVQINIENIEPEFTNNFEKYDNSMVDTQNTPYDYGSVMHYEPYAFSSNMLPTIEGLQPNVEFGQRINMSTTDILEVRLAYNCSSTGITFPPIPTTTIGNFYATNVTISSSLSSNSENFTRPYAENSSYYEVFAVTVPVIDAYIFISTSSMDTIAYLYRDNFYKDEPLFNLFRSDDDSGGNQQFKISEFLNTDRRYVLVITTLPPLTTGNYTLSVFGSNMVNLTKINSSSIISTTTVTPAPNVTGVTSYYSSDLTTNSPMYDRFGGFGRYYYEAVMINVPVTGGYAIASNSTIDTYGYLYVNSFNPLNIEENLLAGDDNTAGDNQFGILSLLQSTETYILVVTTSQQDIIGPVTILIEGQNQVNFTSMNSTTTSITTSTTTSTSTSTTTSISKSTSTITLKASSSSIKSNILLISIICGYVLIHFI